MTEWVSLCQESVVMVDSPAPYDIRDKKIMLLRTGDSIYATDRTCTHEDADLSMGFVSSEGVRCPLHLSVFDMNTGSPQNPPAQEPLTTYKVKIQDGRVWVRI